MGAAIDTGEGGKGKREVNVELNVVPFIDLMSCLTAFLLVTAVWTNLAQISIKPKGIGRDAEKMLDEEPPANISVLLTKEDMWVGVSGLQGDRQQIKNLGEGQYDWEAFEKVLGELKQDARFSRRQDIELAAEDEVSYENIIAAMDSAIASGFRDVGYVDPQSLSVRFKQ
ncbi:MAG: biopolymer transporter ExbD [Deltaproteobacteria bacterium]|nr:MAG: biopolymer transporter ExbD [Deltaproteobacteria bacterium]